MARKTTLSLKQCVCGEWFKGGPKVSDCPKCRSVNRETPLKKGWRQNFKHLWPDFLEFYREVGDPPGPAYRLSGLHGTTATPGNAQWVKTNSLGTIDLSALPHTTQMLFDDEIKHYAHLAFEAQQNSSLSEIVRLDQLEKEFKELSQPDDLEAWEANLEQLSHDYAVTTRHNTEVIQADQGKGSQVSIGRSLRGKLIPLLVEQMKTLHAQALGNRSGVAHHVVKPMLELLEHDYYLVAHVTLSCVLDAVGTGHSMDTTATSLCNKIGDRLEHEALISAIKEQFPEEWRRIDQWALKSDVRGYIQKIQRAKWAIRDRDFQFKYLSAKSKVQLGNWCWIALQSVTGWFDQIHTLEGSAYKGTYMVGLSEEGLKVRDVIQAAKDAATNEPWPMVCKPQRWEGPQRGGYLTPYDMKTAQKIHNNVRGDQGNLTVASETADAALNKAQEVPYKINQFIYQVQKALLPKTEEIGSFRTYERDSYEAKYKPLPNPAIWDLPKVRDKSGKLQEDPEVRKAKNLMHNYYTNQKRAEKQRKSPRRILSVAARFLHVDRFYLPTYFDSRLRIYYTVETISPNGSDFQKALLLFANGLEVTPENQEQVTRDLLITLANTWGNKVPEMDDVKSDKLSLEDRVSFGLDFLKELEVVAKDPLSTQARVYWTEASEPFQFLAVVREIFEVLIWKNKTHTNVPNGRDATNSGMQLLGSICGDEDAMKFTNVIPSDVPQDLYDHVAKYAHILLNSETWVAERLAKYRNSQEKAMRKALKDGTKWRAPKSQGKLTIDPSEVTRSTLKRAVMCTSYGAGWASKNEYIQDQLKEDEVDFTYIDSKLVTDASIEGLSLAFPKCDELQDWFKLVGNTAVKQGLMHLEWKTQNGSHIVQEYREPDLQIVQTHAMGGAKYRKHTITEDRVGQARLHVMTGYKDTIKKNKHGTALGANFTHSLDACFLQNTVVAFNNPAFFVVHDCFYGRASEMPEFVQHARDAFYDVVTAKPMHNLVLSNNLPIEPPTKDNTNLLKDSREKATFMFS